MIMTAYVLFPIQKSKFFEFSKSQIYTLTLKFEKNQLAYSKCGIFFGIFGKKIRRNEVVWKRIWLMTLNLIKSLGRFQYSALCKSEMLKPHMI